MPDVNMGVASAYMDLDITQFKNGLNEAYGALDSAAGKVSTAGQQMEKSVASSATEVGKAFGAALESVGGQIESVGTKLSVLVTAPLALLGKKATSSAIDFEAAMSEVSALSGATGESLAGLADNAKQMGSVTKFTALESAEAMKYMGQAGWKAEQMIAGLPGIVDLSAASGEDLARVSNIVTDALTAFGLSAEDSGRFADVLAVAANETNTDVAMLGESFKYVAPVAGAMKYSVDDVALALGLMANSGIKASQAGTSLRATISNMVDPTDRQATIMDKLGLSVTNMDGSMKSWKDVMGNIRTSMSGLSEDEQAYNASVLFGQEAMSGMLAIINASQEDYDKLSDSIINADGTAKRMAETLMDNTKGAIELASGAIEGLGLSMGELLLPTVRKVADVVAEYATKLDGLSDEKKEFILKILGITAAMGPMLVIMGKGVSGIGKIVTAFSTLGTSAMLPVAAVVAVLAGLFIAWKTDFGGMRDIVANLVESLTGSFEKIKTAFVDNILGKIPQGAIAFEELFGSIMEIAGGALSEIFDLVADAFVAMSDVIGDILGTAIEIVTGIIDTIKNILNNAQFRNAMKSAFDGVISIVETTMGVVSSIIEDIWGMVESAWAQSTGDIEGNTESAFVSIAETIADVIGTIKETIEKVLNTIKTLWDNNFLNIKGTVQFVFNEIVDAIKFAIEFIQDTLKIVMNIISGDWGEAWKGIQELFGKVWDWILSTLVDFLMHLVDNIITIGVQIYLAGKEMWNKFWAGCKELWANITDWFDILWEDPARAFKILGDKMLEWGKSVINSLGEGLKSAWDSVVGWFTGIVDWVTEKWNYVVDKFNAIVGKNKDIIQSENNKGVLTESQERQRAATEAANSESGKSNKATTNTFNFNVQGISDPVGTQRALEQTMDRIAEGY